MTYILQNILPENSISVGLKFNMLLPMGHIQSMTVEYAFVARTSKFPPSPLPGH